MRNLFVLLSCLACAPVWAAPHEQWAEVFGFGGPGPSGSNNPVVPANQTFADTLKQAYAEGLLTPEQVQAICDMRLGVYSYYWAVVGDPLQKVGAGRAGGDAATSRSRVVCPCAPCVRRRM